MTLDEIHQSIEAAIAERTRDFCTGNNVQLIAVSKTRTPQEIQPIVNAGISILGENQVQEAQKKIPLISGASWHLIGHLQTNKAKYAVKLFDLIHSVDSERLLQEINSQAGKLGKVQDILLQINLAQEESKFGMDEVQLDALAQLAMQLPNVNLRGLMIIGPLTEEQGYIREVFKRGYGHFERLKAVYKELDILSMGMSDDYCIAIQEGANMIRLGSKIFGARVYKK